MSTDDTQPGIEDPPAGQPDVAGGDREPTEDELRAAYEAELSRLTTTDVMAQTVVSLLNLGARRLAPAAGDQPAGAGDAAPPERDLEQVRDAIDAVRALLEIVERRIPSRELGPLRDALSRLQMAYAHEVGPGAPAAAREQGPTPSGPTPSGPTPSGPTPSGPTPSGEQPSGPGPAESSGRLWVPGR
jgi:hypothetical protein